MLPQRLQVCTASTSVLILEYLLISSKQGLVSISMLVPDLRIIAEQWDKAAVPIQGQKALSKIDML